MYIMNQIIYDESQLSDVASDIIARYPENRIFGFYGEMGAGKTTLIKEICRVLHVTETTSSPTFAIINEYFTDQDEPVYHFDFYRIDNPGDLYQIGMEEYLKSGSYCFMEWVEKAEDYIKEDFIRVEIEVEEDGKRILKIKE